MILMSPAAITVTDGVAAAIGTGGGVTGRDTGGGIGELVCRPREGGGGGAARWTGDIRGRAAVHTFPVGWVNTKVHPYAWHPSVVYYAPTGEYLMANWGMGCDAQGNEWFQKPSYLGFWTARQPWGPWKQIHEDTSWTPDRDANARAYQPQIAPNTGNIGRLCVADSPAAAWEIIRQAEG